MNLIKLKRNTYDIGIFGKKGCGKSVLLALLGYIRFLQGYMIFSNMPLKYPYIYVDNIETINMIYKINPDIKKIFIGDDFELWFNSKIKNIVKQQLTDIMINWGKVNCSLYYSGKRSMAIAIELRQNTCEFWFPELLLKYIVNTKNKRFNEYMNYKLSQYLNFLNIKVTRFDENIEKLPSILITDLIKIVKLYDTQIMIKPFKIELKNNFTTNYTF